MLLLGRDRNLEWTLLLQSLEPRCRLLPGRAGVSGLGTGGQGRGRGKGGSGAAELDKLDKTLRVRNHPPSDRDHPRHICPGFPSQTIPVTAGLISTTTAFGPETWIPPTPKKDSRCWAIRFPSPGAAPSRRFVVVHPAMPHGARATNGSFFLDGPSGGRAADVALALIPPSMVPPGHHDPLRAARLLTQVAARHVMAGTSVGRRLWTRASSSRLRLPSPVHWLLVEPPPWLCFLGQRTYS